MILKRYVQREILSRLAWILSLLLLVLASHRFVDYLADAAAGRLAGDFVFSMLAMKMLAMLPQVLPMTLFLSVILALSRLHRDRELTVIAGAGVGQRFPMLPVLQFALGFSLVVAGISFYLAPWAEARLEDLSDRARAESDLSGITPGQFREFSEGERIVYVRDLAGQGEFMQEVFVQVQQDDNLAVVKADTARYRTRPDTGSRYVLFEDGRRYVGRPGQGDYRISDYSTYAVLLEQGAPESSGRRLEEYPTRELFDRERPRYAAELQWRLSYAISCLLLPLLAVAMNRFAFAEQRYTPLFVAILVYFVYSNLQGISKTLMVHDGLSLSIGLWWVHGVMLSAILLMQYWRSLQLRFRSLAGRWRRGGT